MITLILSIIGFAALFMAIWILHRPLDVHSCPVKWVRITHNVLEWVLNAWAVVIVLNVAGPRESKEPGLELAVERYVERLIEDQFEGSDSK